MKTPSTLVIIRCQRCRTQLGSLDAMPEDWSGNLTITRCRKCVIPSHSRFIDVLRQQNATAFALGMDIPLAELRPHALKAGAATRRQRVNRTAV
jgi:hypothetical protein